MEKCFKYKLYNSNKNIRIHNLINLSGEIYNHCIALHKRYYRLYKKYLSKYNLQKHITKLKKKRLTWNNLPSQSIQQITERIDNAYKKFFKYLKNKEKKSSYAFRVSPPTFKKITKYKSFTLKQVACKVKEEVITIVKNNYKYFNSRPIEGEINTITVKRNSIGDIYICINTTVEKQQTKIPMTGKSAGFDFGLKQFLTASDDTLKNESLNMVECFKDNAKKMKTLQRALSRKQKGSNNRKKCKLAVSKLHIKIANQREYQHHRLANLLLSNYDELYFETLNIKAMQMLWGRKVSDYGFSNFMDILKVKAIPNDKLVLYIDQWYPSSKTCSNCGYIYESLQLRERTWTCPCCTTKHNRDKNASVNIQRVGASNSQHRKYKTPVGAISD